MPLSNCAHLFTQQLAGVLSGIKVKIKLNRLYQLHFSVLKFTLSVTVVLTSVPIKGSGPETEHVNSHPVYNSEYERISELHLFQLSNVAPLCCCNCY